MILASDPDPERFRAAMNAIHVGGTYKITGSDRHRPVDDLLLDAVDLTGAHIVDIGASDGSTSADLIDRMPADFGAFTICDKYLALDARWVGRRMVLTYPDSSQPVLIAGPRFLSWPEQSRAVAALTRRIAERAVGRSATSVSLLGPAAQSRIAADPRVTAQTHDVFEPWPGPTAPHVIKVANLLRRLYFSDDQIVRALNAILASLPDGGHLLILDNPRIEGIQIRGGLFRKDEGRFVTVSTTAHAPEVIDLVLGDAVRTAADQG
ncbi:hypothetical protein [Janibacter sp. GXQ6167]|uniref:hypothetical protein n=1 Tax=Janibacter sp. GXQ6167 TaxID=3240791 RepID=UPI0035242C69